MKASAESYFLPTERTTAGEKFSLSATYQLVIDSIALLEIKVPESQAHIPS
jgi:hypothetical protein